MILLTQQQILYKHTKLDSLFSCTEHTKSENTRVSIFYFKVKKESQI